MSKKIKQRIAGAAARGSAQMLSFDIETTGLYPTESDVTLVCVEDFHTKMRWKYEFARARVEDPDSVPELERSLIQQFDEADSLCAFNGIKFDIPFLQVALKIEPEKAEAWKEKTSDSLEECRHTYKHTCSLNKLCQSNGIPVKISSGLEAINMAKDGRWGELLEYCEADVSILTQLYEKRVLKNPRTGVMMDLARWAPDNLYEDPWYLEDSDGVDSMQGVCASDPEHHENSVDSPTSSLAASPPPFVRTEPMPVPVLTELAMFD